MSSLLWLLEMENDDVQTAQTNNASKITKDTQPLLDSCMNERAIAMNHHQSLPVYVFRESTFPFVTLRDTTCCTGLFFFHRCMLLLIKLVSKRIIVFACSSRLRLSCLTLSPIYV
jgi:hypothetical protein